MVSLRFPFSFSQSPKHPPSRHASRSFAFSAAASVAAAVTTGVGIGLAIAHKAANPDDPFVHKVFGFFASSGLSPTWASLSLADGSAGTVVEPKTGVAFPALLEDGRRLLGTGIRRKCIMGLKNIDVYAFGIYADDHAIRNILGEKFGKLSVSELKDNKYFYEEVLDQDLGMTVRLQIVYGRLSIRSVRSAFEESVGSRLQKFGGPDNKELLQRFTSQFKDEFKLPRGSVIDISREQGHVLRTTINGTEVGAIQSKLLGRSLLDLYVGDDPFDRHAKEEVEMQLASMIHN